MPYEEGARTDSVGDQQCRAMTGPLDWTLVYNELKQIRKFREAYVSLEKVFATGFFPSFVHFVASQVDGNAHTMEHIVEYSRMKNLRFDTPNGRGQTALEAAIRVGNIDTVSILLAAGASVKLKNFAGMSPLEVVLSTRSDKESDIGALLLANGASINVDEKYISCYRTSSTDVNSSFGGWHTDPSVLAYCLLACQRSFGNNFQSEEATGAYRGFLQAWRMSSGTHPALVNLAAKCLQLFLVMGCSPFVEETPAYVCQSGRCKTLAALSVYHTPNIGYTNVIFKHCAQRYVGDLVDLLLHPCPGRLPGLQDDSLPNLLKETVSNRGSNMKPTDLVEKLKAYNGQDPEIASLMNVLVEMQDQNEMSVEQ